MISFVLPGPPALPCVVTSHPAAACAPRDKGKEYAASLLAPASGALTVGILLLAGPAALATYGALCRRAAVAATCQLRAWQPEPPAAPGALLHRLPLLPACLSPGIDVGPLLASVGGLSVAVGLAVRSLASDVVAGLGLLTRRPFMVADRVQLLARGSHVVTVRGLLPRLGRPCLAVGGVQAARAARAAPLGREPLTHPGCLPHATRLAPAGRGGGDGPAERSGARRRGQPW